MPMDTTHNVKNLYNNFVKIGTFVPYLIDCQHENTVFAKFSDVVEVYNSEKGKGVKLAYKLSDTV